MIESRPLDIKTIPLEGANLIEAGAGTGKTFTITRLYLRLLLEKKLDVRQILVVTFTEAATKELIDRIRDTLQQAYRLCESNAGLAGTVLEGVVDDRTTTDTLITRRSLLNRALTRFDEAAIHTIHGFCRKMLSDYSFETASLFDTELINDQQELISNIADDFHRRHFSQALPLFSAIALFHGFNTTGMAELANLALRNITAKVVPEAERDVTGDLQACLDSIKQEWTGSSEEVMDLLVNDKGLSRAKTKYRVDTLEEIFAEANRIVSENAVSRIPLILPKLSSGALAGSIKKDHLPPGHRFFDLCEQFVALQKQYIIQLKQEYIGFLIEELARHKKEQNLKSFDDLLLDVRDVVRSETSGKLFRKTLRKVFSAVLIDEFQDTDPVQYEIFHHLFEGHSALFYIGDPKQAIYKFRGADVFSYFKASSAIETEKRFTLDTNWRSESGLVDAVNRLFSQTTNPFAAGEAITFFPSKSTQNSKGNREPLVIGNQEAGNLLIWYLKRNEESASGKPINLEEAGQQASKAVINEIRRLLELSRLGRAQIGERELKPSDLAILVLKNDDASRMKDLLTSFNIPAVITKSGNVFESEEAAELHKILLAVSAPTKSVWINTALATEMLGYDSSDILALVEDEQESGQSERHFKVFLDYHEMWQNRGFMRMFRQLLSDYKVRENILTLPNGDRKLTNILHLAELIHTESVRSRSGINGLLSWIYRQRFVSETKEENELRLERDDQAVQINTVFKSKGLQYPVVFCPFMWQRGVSGRLRDLIYHRDGELYLRIDKDSAGENDLEQVRKEELSEKLRLLYVALTRAQNRCYLVCGKIGSDSFNSIDYVLHGGVGENELTVADYLKKKPAFDDEQMKQKAADLADEVLSEKADSKTDIQLPGDYHPAGTKVEKLSRRTFSGKNHWLRNWGIASYSRLVSGETYSPEIADDHSLLTDESREPQFIPEPDHDTDSFFGFPRGRVAGTCIHSIFEKIDFTDSTPETVHPIIMEELAYYNLLNSDTGKDDSEMLINRVSRMINRVLNSSLKAETRNICLSEVANEYKLVEFEFHFPVVKLSPENLVGFLKTNDRDHLPEFAELSSRISQLRFHTIEGFMHGFIDLIISHQGKYYLIDWKTNYLGSQYSDYTPEKLSRSMKHSFYDLQYYIYIVALNEYLTSRLPDYQYERDFGGVFYLFVRGMHPDYPGCGVFSDIPGKKLIDAFGRMIQMKEQDED